MANIERDDTSSRANVRRSSPTTSRTNQCGHLRAGLGRSRARSPRGRVSREATTRAPPRWCANANRVVQLATHLQRPPGRALANGLLGAEAGRGVRRGDGHRRQAPAAVDANVHVLIVHAGVVDLLGKRHQLDPLAGGRARLGAANSAARRSHRRRKVLRPHGRVDQPPFDRALSPAGRPPRCRRRRRDRGEPDVCR